MQWSSAHCLLRRLFTFGLRILIFFGRATAFRKEDRRESWHWIFIDSKGRIYINYAIGRFANSHLRYFCAADVSMCRVNRLASFSRHICSFFFSCRRFSHLTLKRSFFLFCTTHSNLREKTRENERNGWKSLHASLTVTTAYGDMAQLFVWLTRKKQKKYDRNLTQKRSYQKIQRWEATTSSPPSEFTSSEETHKNFREFCVCNVGKRLPPHICVSMLKYSRSFL